MRLLGLFLSTVLAVRSLEFSQKDIKIKRIKGGKRKITKSLVEKHKKCSMIFRVENYGLKHHLRLVNGHFLVESKITSPEMKIHIFEVKNELIFKKLNFCVEKSITRKMRSA